MHWRNPARVLPLVVLLGAGCSMRSPQGPTSAVGPQPLPPVLQSANVTINQDAAALESRLVRERRTLLVQPKDAPPAEFAKSGDGSGVRLTLLATVAAPEVDGHVVQANDIAIHDKTALVAYNVAGETFAGAVQIVDFKRPGYPELVAEVLYKGADANAVTLEGSHVFVGLASDDPALASPALVHELKFSGKVLEPTGDWLDLPSWAVTDLAVHGNRLVAGVGADLGGVALVERNHMRLAAFAEEADVRAVDVSPANAVYSVCGGAAALLHKRGLPQLGVESASDVFGYSQEGAKGTLEVVSGRCYLGAGDGGFQVRDASGALLAALANGEYSSRSGRTGVTNAVSVDRNLAFVAAGPAGVQVVGLGETGGEERSRAELRLLGELELEDGASINMVKSRNDILVVAAGLGGVKLIEMDSDD